MITVASHQPDFLPYSGFFHKMAKADVFEIGIYYCFSKSGYQRRVKMREQWASIPIVGKSHMAPINQIRVNDDTAAKTLIDTIRGRYGGSRYWKQRGDDLLSRIEGIHTDKLWQFNLDLMIGVRDMLGIRTPIAIGSPLQGTKTESVVNALKAYGDEVRHLSGPGAAVYMDQSLFDEEGITLTYSKHAPVTGDSIVTVLMDYADPLEIVMREETDA